MNPPIITLRLGIITGEQKRSLERYVDPSLFKQRKNYDEYYVDPFYKEFQYELADLMVISKMFNVTISSNEIEIS